MPISMKLLKFIVDTEPIKRFRYSHIVEMVSIEKVKQAASKTVDSG
jgi:hypothetical protein